MEFALVAPLLIMLVLGAFDFGQSVYVKAVLQGAVQDAGRDAGLESGADRLGEIDDYVRRQVRNVAPGGILVTTRRNYQTFDDVGKPEDFSDANGNDSYDPEECFNDANGNGTWDPDRSKGGIGGADDVVVYTATVRYERIVPLWKIIGWNQTNAVSATTTLRNQPFGDQAIRKEAQVCPS